MTLETLKAQLVSNIASHVQAINCQIDQLVYFYGEGCVHNLPAAKRAEYRNLVVIREFTLSDLETVKGWTVDNLRYYLINDRLTIGSWMGWN